MARIANQSLTCALSVPITRRQDEHLLRPSAARPAGGAETTRGSCSTRSSVASAMTIDVHDFAEIREEVRKLCADFPGEYWRKLDREAAYPGNFVKALGDAGYLAALIPVNMAALVCRCPERPPSLRRFSGPAATAGPAMPRCILWEPCCGTGTTLKSSISCRRSRPANCGCRPSGVTEPSSGTDTSSIKTTAVRHGDRYAVNGQKIWTSRAEHSDLMLLFLARRPSRNRSPSAPTAYPSSCSTCRPPSRRGSRSGRSGR